MTLAQIETPLSVRTPLLVLEQKSRLRRHARPSMISALQTMYYYET
jgi:hypothetical protein